MKSLLIFMTGVLVGACGWHVYIDAYPPAQHSASAAVAKPDFPVDRVLRNQKGAEISARLLARSASEVQLIRLSDNASFRYPIASLSEEDQRFVRRFPETTLRSGADAEPTARPISGTELSPTETRLAQERTELEHKIRILELEFEKQEDKSPTLPRDEIRRRIDQYRNQIIAIDQQLTEIRFHARR